jgi:hypothetical protein
LCGEGGHPVDLYPQEGTTIERRHMTRLFLHSPCCAPVRMLRAQPAAERFSSTVNQELQLSGALRAAAGFA